MEASELVDFWKRINELKLMPRSGWKMRGIKNPETVASHSYGVAVLSILLHAAEGKDVDSGKALKMALFHDLAEAVTGDITLHDKGYEGKDKREMEALKEMSRMLPERIAKEMISLSREFMEGKTEEARLVKRADKLDMFLMANAYESLGHDMSDFYDSRYAEHNTAGFTTRFSASLHALLKRERAHANIKG